jgi:hypothetical protein
VFDDGSDAGPALVAGGDFALAGGQAANHIARWDGLHLSLACDQLATGTGLLFFGFDHAGCGLFAPGLGELLLGVVPSPLLVGSASLSAGAAGFALPVPDDPAVLGSEVAFQGAAAGLVGPDLEIELSNALAVTITR